MADDRMALLETMRKAITDGDADFLREGVKTLAEALMEAEVTELTGVPRGVRDPERRSTHRNGYRERRWDTRVGTLPLSIPRVRDGSYLPSLLEPRRRAERALLAVVQEAYVLGVSTRRVEDLVETLGITSMSRSEVSRICAALDTEVEAFRSRSLVGETYPYLWLDATYVKVRDGGRVVSMAALVAIGVSEEGERRILGLELAPGNDEGSAWPAFIGGLVERGLAGVSTRRVEDLVETLGITSMSKSQVSRICAALDTEVEAFRGRPLSDEAYPYLWLDATYVKVRDAGRVVSMAVLVAIGVSVQGERRVLGLELAPGNDEGSAWPAFIASLTERGLTGVRLVISDDHRGLVRAVHERFLGAAWQRCRVHFTRNAQDLVPRSARSMVATVIRSVFEQPDEAAAREQLRRAVDGLRERFPKVSELLIEAEADLLAHFTFPETHRGRSAAPNRSSA